MASSARSTSPPGPTPPAAGGGEGPPARPTSPSRGGDEGPPARSIRPAGGGGAGDPPPPTKPAAAVAAAPAPAHTNRLASANSPYLLEHAHNPVNWYEWGEDAFAAARTAGKPILLSSGYAACRWCHNMARECFEDEAVAAAMNEAAICVKLDREVRPDVDATYMSYLQATTGGGGWPMTVFLTESGAPFFAGTYFPKDAFLDLLSQVRTLWSTRRVDVESQAASGLAALRRAEEEEEVDTGPLDARAALEGCATALAARFDPVHGGFGRAPKFPRPAELAALHAHRLLTGDAASESMTSSTLLAWASQGVWDAVGGAWARYSVDNLLHVPHFEKMTYDSGQLIRACVFGAGLAAVRASAGVGAGAGASAGAAPPPSTSSASILHPPPAVAAARLGAAAAASAAWLVREMTAPSGSGGAFFAALDAESSDPADPGAPKKEGWFYTWSDGEVESALAAPLDEGAASAAGVPAADLAAAGAAVPHASTCPPALVSAFKAHYGVLPRGNCGRDPRSDPLREFTGRNVLFQARGLGETAASLGADEATTASLLGAARLRLFVARSTRPPPATDDKCVATWNGMAIGALAHAGRALPGLKVLGGADAAASASAAGWPTPAADPHAFLSVAVAAATDVKARLWNPATRRLRRFYRGPVDALASSPPALAEDYAHLACAALDLASTTGDTAWLAWAGELQAALDEDFWDDTPGSGGYFNTDGRDATVVLRKKESYDGAEPAAGSVAAANALRLAALAAPGSEAAAALESRGRAALAALLGGGRPPLAVPQAAASAYLTVAWPLRQVVIVGPRGSPATEALLDAAHAAPAPDAVIIPLFPEDEGCMAFWRAHNPEAVAVGTGPGAPESGAAVAFVCQDFTCRAPTADPAAVAAAMVAPRRGSGGAGFGVVGGGGPKTTTPVDLGSLLGKK